MNAFCLATRYAHTLRYLKPSQVLGRVRFALLNHLSWPALDKSTRDVPPFDEDVAESLRAFLRCCNKHAPLDREALSIPYAGGFGLLDAGAAAPLWSRVEGASKSAYFDAQSMNWLRTFAQAHLDTRGSHDDTYFADLTMGPWRRRAPEAPYARHSFPTAARMINWCLAIAACSSAFDGFVTKDVIRWSLTRLQTAHLLKSIEYDVLANHILKNALALVITGSLLGPDSRVGQTALRQGMRLLEGQLAEQMLPDGGHYERSPMYHCRVLEDCVIAYAALRTKPEPLKRAIENASSFLARILHPDGDIPLFGDSVLGYKLPPCALLDVVRDMCGISVEKPSESCYAAADSGFYAMTTQGQTARLLAKAGPPGPSYQLGHAHCDMLSYELTAGERRVIVDSGVFDYERSAMRDYCRSTRAHNTVSVAGREQLEYWGAFRVGARYRSQVHEWRQEGRTWSLRASHDGFRPYTHEREFLFLEERFWLIIDAVAGPGTFSSESFIHFHPDVSLTEDGANWRASFDERQLIIVPFLADSADCIKGEEGPIQGWYCPRFGIRSPGWVLVLRKTCVRHSCFGYALFPPGAEALSPSALVEMLPAAVSVDS